MTGETNESQASTLCKACGLCCTGHLFIWAKLRSAELDSAQALGLTVVRHPQQRGFSQPCPLWEGVCSIYDSPDYPRFCRTYKCKLLKEVIDESTALSQALPVIGQAKEMIDELELLLPPSIKKSFRERLVEQMEQHDAAPEFILKANALIALFEKRFGVKDFLEKPIDEYGQ